MRPKFAPRLIALAQSVLILPALILPALILPVLSLPAFAQTAVPQDLPPANIDPLHGRDGSVARLIEAHRLAELGQTARDPVLLLAAARLMQGVTLREVPRTLAVPVGEAKPSDFNAIKAAPAEPKPTEKTEKKKTKDAPSDAPREVPAIQVVPDPAQQAPLSGVLDPAALMASARAMLPPDSVLRDAVADLEAEIPPPGPVVQVTALQQAPGGATTFAVALAGQSYAEIGLLRLGPGHLTLLVTDAAGHPVCQDASAGPSVLCGLVPRQSDHFLVTVANDGGDAAPYLLLTN